MNIKRRVHEILEVAAPGDRASRAFDVFILSLIGLNVLALILETIEPIYTKCPRLFFAFEAASVAIFTAEYLLRIWSCTSAREYASPVRGRLRFAVTPLALIDLLAILPFYVPFVALDLRFFRAVRLLRILRLAKLGRYSQALRTIGRVVSAKRAELGVTVFVLLLLLLISSCMMYFAEHDAQPQAFSSIPAAMWWAVVTLTTVGYGDVCPTTLAGKLVGAVMAVLGIGMLALPTGILGAGFLAEMQKRKRPPKTCPHCGKQLPE